jgi:hypothetical protein
VFLFLTHALAHMAFKKDILLTLLKTVA